MRISWYHEGLLYTYDTMRLFPNFFLAVICLFGVVSFFTPSALAADFLLLSTPVSYQQQQASFLISPSFVLGEPAPLSYTSRTSILPTGVSVQIASSTASSTPVIVSYDSSAPSFFFVTIDAVNPAGIRHSVSVPISPKFSQFTSGSPSVSANDFLLIAKPSAVSLSSGASTSFSVTAVPITGDLHPVNLRVESVATVFTDVVLSNQQLSPASPTTVVTVSAHQSVSSGLYPLSIVATNTFGVSHTLTILVTIAGSKTYASVTSPIFSANTSSVASSTSVSTTSLPFSTSFVSSPPFYPEPISCRRLVYALYGVDSRAIDSLTQAVGRGDIVILRPFRFDLNSSFDPEFAALVSKLQGLGAIVYFSIDGQYGFSDFNTARSTVDLLQDWYRIDGIAVYNVATTPDAASFFNAFASYIRSRNLSPIFVFSGYPSHAFYASLIDYAVFEHFTIADADTVPSRDFFEYPEQKRISLIHSVGSNLDLAVSVSPYTPFVAFTQQGAPASLVSHAFFSQAREILSRRCISTPLSVVTAASSPEALLLRLQILLKNLLARAGL